MRKQTNIFFSFDFLIIYDGGSTTSPMMGKYCGDSIPPSHISSSKEIMVHFETNSYNIDLNGFKMEYHPTGKQNTSVQNHTEYFSSFLKDIWTYRAIGKLLFKNSRTKEFLESRRFDEVFCNKSCLYRYWIQKDVQSNK